jgi:AcrR family transcriptional regulator
MASPTVPGGEQLDRRARVHSALIELCFEQGFAELSVEQLCERAGIERSVFDRDYADLEGCFCQIYVIERDRFFVAREAACEGLEGWLEQLRASAYALLNILGSDPELANFVIVEPHVAGERALLLMEGVIATMLDLLDQGRRHRDDPEAISRATAESIAGSIFLQIYMAIVHDHSELTERRLREMMYAAVLPYLGAAAATAELETPPPTAIAPAPAPDLGAAASRRSLDAT